jgi:hypothetical protein
MKPFSDLNALLQDGCSLKYDWQFQGLQAVTISTHQIAELIVTSGRIIACDPLIGADTRYYFQKTITPGRYPVVVSVADFQPIGDTRLACAMLRISNEPTAHWEVATMNEPDPAQTEQRTAYGVDAGTGCFVDSDAAHIIQELFPNEVEFEEFCDQVIMKMKKNSLGKYSLAAAWADIQVSEAVDANMIAFSSGWGDGGYASFWGYDARGTLTGLVTDFALFPSNDAA